MPRPGGCKRNRAAKAQLRRFRVSKLGTVVHEENVQGCNNVAEPSTSTSVDVSEGNFSVISEQEYDSVMAHELTMESVTPEKGKDILIGHRIVNLSHVLKWSMKLQQDHSKICTLGELQLKKESRVGLISTITFECNQCHREYVNSSVPRDSLINISVVWATLAIGSTYEHTAEFLAVLEVPGPSKNFFHKNENSLGYVWKETLENSMTEAGQTERQIAIEEGRVDPDGVPYISVYLDGGWSKRSYGHNYDAYSGAAVIIGKKTQKVLYVGIRNKYCSICARANNKLNETPNAHVCFMNWSGSSTAMESDIICEGFNQSISMHGIRYKTFIADGDSSVFAKIREKVDYGSEVVKVECVNHAVKNFSKKLHIMKSDSKNFPLQGRKILTAAKIKELSKNVQEMIRVNRNGDLEVLKEDLLNTLDHAFGDHSRCRDGICDLIGNTEDTKLLSTLQLSGVRAYISGALEQLVMKREHLIENETNNCAELFMAIMARFNMGKRLNLVQRGSFERRATLAGLRYNDGPLWHLNSWKKVAHRSPGKVLKKYVNRQATRAAKRRLAYKTISRRKTTFSNSQRDRHYGSNSQQPELSDNELEAACERKLLTLQVTKEEQLSISNLTVGQFNNQIYMSNKRERLTASFFGSVCKRRPDTSCHVLVRSILYPKQIITAALEYGKVNESVAKQKFAEEQHCTVQESGLFVDIEHGFLGASPDGLIGDDELIEIKCLYTCSKAKLPGETLLAFVQRRRNATCLEISPDGLLRLKRSHNYYYQIQGQLHITGRSICNFVVFVDRQTDLFIEKIPRDHNFWTTKMLEKLSTFYKKCILPEIILRNVRKGEKCLDPPYILAAKDETNKQKKRNRNFQQ